MGAPVTPEGSGFPPSKAARRGILSCHPGPSWAAAPSLENAGGCSVILHADPGEGTAESLRPERRGVRRPCPPSG